MITKKTKLNKLIEKIREESYHLLTNNCFGKSFKFKRKCHELGVEVRIVICIGLVKAKWFGHWVTILVPHGWADMNGIRIELGRQLGTPGLWETIGEEIKPIVAIWI